MSHARFLLVPAVDLAQEGNYITLRNAKIDMYRGSMRIAVDQWGKVEALEGSSFQPKVRIDAMLKQPMSQHCNPHAFAVQWLRLTVAAAMLHFAVFSVLLG